jgi:predicted acetyltransferase
MDDIKYYLATEADIETLIEFRVGFLIEFLGPQTEAKTQALQANLREFFARTLEARSYICWFAKSRDDLAGVGGLSVRQHPGNFLNLSGKTGYIMNMYTLPAHRRKGICSEILIRLQQTAKEMGIYSFELHATKEGEMVYTQHNFKLHNEPTYRKYAEADFK